MTQVLPYWILSLAAGLTAGTVYFFGLWWTVLKLPTSRQPALLTLGSFGLRTILVLGVFYIVGHGHWDRLLICLAGFFLARVLVTRRMQPGAAPAPEHAGRRRKSPAHGKG